MVDAEKIVLSLVDFYGLKLDRNHIKNVIDEVRKLNLSEEASYTVAKNLLDIGESYFFRDSPTWQAIDRILSSFKSVKMLSLGCSEGEEVYTFSFVAKKWTEPYMLGIDACEERINIARVGMYDRWKLRKVKESDINIYFNKVGNRYAVKDLYKENAHFFAENITNFESKDRFDFIFVRRVLIYLRREILSEVIRKIHRLLSDDGYVVLGRGEIYEEMLEVFEPVKVMDSIFWRKKSPKAKIDYEDEINFFENYIIKTSKDYVNMVKQLINGRMYEEALIWIENAYDFGVESKEIVNYHITALLNLNRDDEARKVLKKALLLNPNDQFLNSIAKVIL